MEQLSEEISRILKFFFAFVCIFLFHVIYLDTAFSFFTLDFLNFLIYFKLFKFFIICFNVILRYFYDACIQLFHEIKVFRVFKFRIFDWFHLLNDLRSLCSGSLLIRIFFNWSLSDNQRFKSRRHHSLARKS